MTRRVLDNQYKQVRVGCIEHAVTTADLDGPRFNERRHSVVCVVWALFLSLGV